MVKFWNLDKNQENTDTESKKYTEFSVLFNRKLSRNWDINCDFFCSDSVQTGSTLGAWGVELSDTSSLVLIESRVSGLRNSSGGLGVSDTRKSSSPTPSSDMARELMSANWSNTESGSTPSWRDSSVSWLAREMMVSVRSSWTSVRMGFALIFCRALRTDSSVLCCIEDRFSSSNMVLTLLTAASWDGGSSLVSVVPSPGVVLRTTRPWAGVTRGVSQASLWPRDSGVRFKLWGEWGDSLLLASEISCMGRAYWSWEWLLKALPPLSEGRGDPKGWGDPSGVLFCPEFWYKKHNWMH